MAFYPLQNSSIFNLSASCPKFVRIAIFIPFGTRYIRLSHFFVLCFVDLGL